MISYAEIIKAELDGLYGEEVNRDMHKTIQLYNVYEGKSPQKDYSDLDYTPTSKNTNFVKKLIKEEARFLFGKTPEIIVKSEDEESAEKIQQYLNKVLKDNEFSRRIIEAARDCFIGKRVAIKLSLNQERQLRCTFSTSLGFVYDTEEDDTGKLSKIIFFHGMNEKTDKKEQRIWKQKYHMENGKCILNQGIYDGYGQLVKAVKTDTDTKLDFIPAKVVLNDGLSGDPHGESDVEELQDLQKIYDALICDDIDALKFNMFPQTVATDASAESLEKMKIAPAALIDLQTDATAGDGTQATLQKLESSFNYDTRIENTLNRIKSEMFELLNVPNVTPAELKGFMTSGKSMKALYWQLVTRCEEKYTSWRPALEWLMWSILKMTTVYRLEPLDIPDDLIINVENIYPLIEDEMEEKQLDLLQVNAQAMSRKAFIQKWGKDVSPDQADDELKQIQLEKEMLQDNFGGGFGGDE